MHPPPTLLLATRSEDKVREVREILARVNPPDILTLHDLGIPATEAEDQLEVHDTFRANALAKARYFAALTSMPVLSEDSGLVVHALGGAPGVRSKRFCDRPDLHGLALDLANNGLLLERLRGVPPEQRSAHYVCAAAFLAPRAAAVVGIGTVSGAITLAPVGSHGFGYDPLFLFPSFGATFGETPAARKHGVSHRARALRALAAVSSGQLQG